METIKAIAGDGLTLILKNFNYPEFPPALDNVWVYDDDTGAFWYFDEWTKELLECEVCDHCNGTGYRNGRECKACHGITYFELSFSRHKLTSEDEARIFYLLYTEWSIQEAESKERWALSEMRRRKVNITEWWLFP